MCVTVLITFPLTVIVLIKAYHCSYKPHVSSLVSSSLQCILLLTILLQGHSVALRGEVL